MQLSYDLYQLLVRALMPYITMMWCDLPDLTLLPIFKGIDLRTIMYVYLAHPARIKYVQPRPNVFTDEKGMINIILAPIPYTMWAMRKRIPHGGHHTVLLDLPNNVPDHRLYRKVDAFVEDMLFFSKAQIFFITNGSIRPARTFPGRVAQYALAKFPSQIRWIKGAYEFPHKPILCVYGISKAQYTAALKSWGIRIKNEDTYPLVLVEAQRSWGRFGYMRLGGVEYNNEYFRSLVPYAQRVSVYGEDPELLEADAIAAGYGFQTLTRSVETIDILASFNEKHGEDAGYELLLDAVDEVQLGSKTIRALNIQRLLRTLTTTKSKTIYAKDVHALVDLCRSIGYSYIDFDDKLHIIEVAGKPEEEPVLTR